MGGGIVVGGSSPFARAAFAKLKTVQVRNIAATPKLAGLLFVI